MRTLSLLMALTAVTAAAGQPGGLRIVVIEGEGAVNVIQQKTAVAPMVEVRDRNNLPVPGAVVTFTIQAGPNAAVAGGAQTLTVTTNAAGRAAMAAINPVNSGTFQIQVQAAFQGQTAAAAITQINVLTAAQAAGAAAAGAGAAGAGSGGGLGGGAIAGIVGGAAAVAGVAVALPKLSGDESGDSGGDATVPIDPAVAAAAGVYTLQQINGAGLPGLTVLSPPNPCPGFTDSGTMTLTASPQVFDMNERSHLQCSAGSGNTFNSSNGGSWSLQGATIAFTSSGGQFNIGQGSLSGSTLTFDFDAPHANTGNPAFRVTSVWRK